MHARNKAREKASAHEKTIMSAAADVPCPSTSAALVRARADKELYRQWALARKVGARPSPEGDAVPGIGAVPTSAASAAGRESGTTSGDSFFEIIVPEGARPGDVLTVAAGGKRLEITVPEGGEPGVALMFEVRGGSDESQHESPGPDPAVPDDAPAGREEHIPIFPTLREGWLEKLSVSAPAPLKNWRRRYITLASFGGVYEICWSKEPGDQREPSMALRLERGAEVALSPLAHGPGGRGGFVGLQVRSCGRTLSLRGGPSAGMDQWKQAIDDAVRSCPADSERGSLVLPG